MYTILQFHNTANIAASYNLFKLGKFPYYLFDNYMFYKLNISNDTYTKIGKYCPYFLTLDFLPTNSGYVVLSRSMHELVWEKFFLNFRLIRSAWLAGQLLWLRCSFFCGKNCIFLTLMKCLSVINKRKIKLPGTILIG